jgi:hypothetical protein
MKSIRDSASLLAICLFLAGAWSVWAQSKKAPSPQPQSQNDTVISNHAQQMLEQGKQIFRYDTFGDEAYWGDSLRLHEAIAGEHLGGVGPGVSPKTALAVGMKVDVDALPASLVSQLKAGKVNLDDPATTLALLKLNSVVGVTGHFDNQGKLVSMGIQCAFCHSSVDDSLVPGIGHRLDGWGNRDLNVGAIVSLAPNLQAIADELGVDVPTVKKVLASWGPGCFDAELDKDGKGLRPDGKRACTLIPPAYGLAGVNLHTWTGFGSVPYWNAYVGVGEMHGSGTFFDARLADKKQYPVSAKIGSYNSRGKPDQLTSKLAALHFYQLAIPAPKPPKGSFDEASAARGKDVFETKGKCAVCHVPPLYTEPGNNLHAPTEIGVDSFQADRAPTHMYRTAPLAGLWSRQNRGFYHDGRFQTLDDVINHYDQHMNLGLTKEEKKDLVEFVKSL